MLASRGRDRPVTDGELARMLDRLNGLEAGSAAVLEAGGRVLLRVLARAEELERLRTLSMSLLIMPDPRTRAGRSMLRPPVEMLADLIDEAQRLRAVELELRGRLGLRTPLPDDARREGLVQRSAREKRP